eukprot:ANDGO_01928.mRNA.1 Amino acid transporter ANT1
MGTQDIEMATFPSKTTSASATQSPFQLPPSTILQSPPQKNLDNSDSVLDVSSDGLSPAKTTFTLIAVIAGAGLLSLPYAVRLAGWIAIPLMAFTCMVSNNTAESIARMMITHNLHSFPEIGQKAFGAFGKYVIMFVHKCTLVGIGILYLVLAGINVKSIAIAYSSNNSSIPGVSVWIAICGVVILPVMYIRHIHEAPLLTLFGACASGFAAIAVIIDSVTDLATETNDSRQVDIDLEGTPVSMASVAFAFCVQTVVPPVVEAMKEPKKFPVAMRWSSVIVISFYALVAGLGYAAYGLNTESPVTLNMPQTAPLTTVAVAAVTAHVMVIFPVMLNPVCVVIEGHHAWAESTILRAVSRTALTVFCVGVGVSVPYFGDVMSLIGAFFLSSLVFIFPSVFELKIEWTRIGTARKMWNVFVFIFGLAICVVGTIFAVNTLVTDFETNPPQF